jgi:hypothetical protein
MKKCINCSQLHNRKGIYCSKKCTDKAYRERKKSSLQIPSTDSEERVKIKIPKEKGEKLKWCNFCGASLENSKKLNFCNDDHEYDYWFSVKISKPLKLRLDNRTLIETLKYDKVQEIVERMNAKKMLIYNKF